MPSLREFLHWDQNVHFNLVTISQIITKRMNRLLLFLLIKKQIHNVQFIWREIKNGNIFSNGYPVYLFWYCIQENFVLCNFVFFLLLAVFVIDGHKTASNNFSLGYQCTNRHRRFFLYHNYNYNSRTSHRSGTRKRWSPRSGRKTNPITMSCRWCCPMYRWFACNLCRSNMWWHQRLRRRSRRAELSNSW